MRTIETVQDFGTIIKETLVSDRDVVIAFAGMTGEGKSCGMTQLGKEYTKAAGLDFKYSCMTYSREELLKWIDGDKEGKGQMPEYSLAIADELISMFYRRNWYEDEQKAAVELFNKCRDRHMLIMGGIPNFWDLDGGMLSRIRFYIYIPRRGVAWVFEQENNPFAADKWNCSENKKTFRKKKNPYSCPNFVCEFHFADWSPKEKTEYYAIRNTKRLDTEAQNKKKEAPERYGKIKQQRDEAIRMVYETGNYTQEDISKRVVLGQQLISKITNGLR